MPGPTKPIDKGMEKKNSLFLCQSNRSLPGLAFINLGFLLLTVRGPGTITKHTEKWGRAGYRGLPVLPGPVDVIYGVCSQPDAGAGLLDLLHTGLG